MQARHALDASSSGFRRLKCGDTGFYQLYALILIKNYQLVANPHVRAVQSWHLRGVPQAVDQSRALCSNITGIRSRLEYQLATRLRPVPGDAARLTTARALAFVDTMMEWWCAPMRKTLPWRSLHQQPPARRNLSAERLSPLRGMVRLPKEDSQRTTGIQGDGALAVASTPRGLPRHAGYLAVRSEAPPERRRYFGISFYTIDHRKRPTPKQTLSPRDRLAAARERTNRP